MTEHKKPINVIFAPGLFDNFEGTQEELDEMLAEIQALADSGELLELAEPIDLDNWTEEDDEMVSELVTKINDTKRKLH
ncbi:MAG: hypothetical protein ACOVLB_09120 [Candidatus Nanopelagicus sp.]